MPFLWRPFVLVHFNPAVNSLIEVKFESRLKAGWFCVFHSLSMFRLGVGNFVSSFVPEFNFENFYLIFNYIGNNSRLSLNKQITKQIFLRTVVWCRPVTYTPQLIDVMTEKQQPTPPSEFSSFPDISSLFLLSSHILIFVSLFFFIQNLNFIYFIINLPDVKILD